MENPTQSTKCTTPFQKKVYAGLAGIPLGFVATYGTLAKWIGCGSSQAIGQALKNNPFSPQVPCHRVVKKDGTLGGFFGKTSNEAIRKKRYLLECEGIVFERSGKIPERFILRTKTVVCPSLARENYPANPAGGIQ
jgi:methylated-DNA-[protein]-cysteine S-methyltransferase